MQKRTVRGVYDNGELRFAEPVQLDGCWKITITFIEREDGPQNIDPHAPEKKPVPDRLEELHRNIEADKPRIGPL